MPQRVKNKDCGGFSRKYRRRGHRELFVACAQAFGETRSTERIGDTESFLENIGEWGFSPFACTSTLLPAWWWVLVIDGDAQGGKGLAPCHLEPQQHRAALPPSPTVKLSNSPTVKLSNCQTFQSSFLKKSSCITQARDG